MSIVNLRLGKYVIEVYLVFTKYVEGTWGN